MGKKYHYVYMVINKVNGMKYIGKHSGELNDDYLGSGEKIKAAVKKYGKKNFRKVILMICPTEKIAYQKEKEFIEYYNAVKRKDFYNMIAGGEQTWRKKNKNLQKKKKKNV